MYTEVRSVSGPPKRCQRVGTRCWRVMVSARRQMWGGGKDTREERQDKFWPGPQWVNGEVPLRFNRIWPLKPNFLIGR